MRGEGIEGQREKADDDDFHMTRRKENFRKEFDLRFECRVELANRGIRELYAVQHRRYCQHKDERDCRQSAQRLVPLGCSENCVIRPERHSRP